MRLHLVDGTYELFRAHFSKRPSRLSPSGRDIKATVGAISSLISLLNDEKERVTHLGVAFDHPIENFRNRLMPTYKDSSLVEPALLDQFDEIEQGVAALGVTVWPMDEYEADDALATAATRWSGDFDEVRILSPDKDLHQVVSGTRIVQVDRMRQVILDEQAVVDKFGVPPTSIPHFLALVGDAADRIPGITGFGAKSASAILDRYQTIEAIPTDAQDWDIDLRGKQRLAETLREKRDIALGYRQLTRLITDVPLPQAGPEDLRLSGIPRDRFHAWCDRLGVTQLRDQPRTWA